MLWVWRPLTGFCFLLREAAPTCWKPTLEHLGPTWLNAATRRSSAPTWWRPTRTSSETVLKRAWSTSLWKTVSAALWGTHVNKSASNKQSSSDTYRAEIISGTAYTNVVWSNKLLKKSAWGTAAADTSPSSLWTVLLCGLDGFSDFYKADWLQRILRQQDEELGCFGKDSECLTPLFRLELQYYM